MTALPIGRIAGFGLLSLGATLIYNLLAAAYFAYLQFGGELIGRLLLPAIAIHAILTLLCTRAWVKHQSAEASKP